jgi:hypothetical protein
MSRLTQNRWFRRFGFGAFAALSLGALVSTSPAEAREYGYRAPVAHHAAFFPRVFFGGGHYWHHWGHQDHRWR